MVISDTHLMPPCLSIAPTPLNSSRQYNQCLRTLGEQSIDITKISNSDNLLDSPNRFRQEKEDGAGRNGIFPE